MTENSTNENITAQSCSGGSPKEQAANSVSLDEARTADGTDKQDVCSGIAKTVKTTIHAEVKV